MFARVVAPAFFRREPRMRAWSYLLGLVAGLERANGWTLAEFAGDAAPDGMQRLLNAARWDEDEVRDRLVGYVAADPGGVLIADETGFEKSGTMSAGVQRQYAGTAGKVTNCQVGVTTHGVGRETTVRRAIIQLTAEGLLEPVRRRGTVVCARPARPDHPLPARLP